MDFPSLCVTLTDGFVLRAHGRSFTIIVYFSFLVSRYNNDQSLPPRPCLDIPLLLPLFVKPGISSKIINKPQEALPPHVNFVPRHPTPFRCRFCIIL